MFPPRSLRSPILPLPSYPMSLPLKPLCSLTDVPFINTLLLSHLYIYFLSTVNVLLFSFCKVNRWTCIEHSFSSPQMPHSVRQKAQFTGFHVVHSTLKLFHCYKWIPIRRSFTKHVFFCIYLKQSRQPLRSLFSVDTVAGRPATQLG